VRCIRLSALIAAMNVKCLSSPQKAGLSTVAIASRSVGQVGIKHQIQSVLTEFQ
jgi:hypothetical protein